MFCGLEVEVFVGFLRECRECRECEVLAEEGGEVRSGGAL